MLTHACQAAQPDDPVMLEGKEPPPSLESLVSAFAILVVDPRQVEDLAKMVESLGGSKPAEMMLLSCPGFTVSASSRFG